MGKRSPILGYNHNVRYRGLVFHVQTEDSGVASPHLFTHLFHHGVIVSTRKLDYDAGSAEESIKALMQAQHKAVLKDLRRGQFDDKIDSYLGGTPGLLPRGAEDAPDRPSEAELAPSQGTVEEIAIGAPTEQILPTIPDEPSAPVMIVEKTPPSGRVATTPIPPVPSRVTERRSAVIPAAAPPLPPAAVAASAADTPSTKVAARGSSTALGTRGQPAAVDTTLKTAVPAFEVAPETELSAEIEIQLIEEGDDAVSGGPRRAPRDTETQLAVTDQTRPTLNMELDDHARPTLEDQRPTLGMTADEIRRAATISDGIPASRPSNPSMPPPLPADTRRLGDRPSTINAATLPPARPISRPAPRQAVTSPQAAARPLPTDDRSRRESEAVESYASASSADAQDRSGQYAQHKKISGRIPIEGLKNDRSGGVSIPAGLGPPRRAATAPTSGPSGPPAKPTVPVPAAPPPPPRDGVSRAGGGHTEPLRGRVPTPAAAAPAVPARAPAMGRPSTNSGNGNGVVMTRPAVIVGAPQKAPATVPRIRKAREDEGRGFGQGLISEKSLDEVILAYLSEDADEK